MSLASKISAITGIEQPILHREHRDRKSTGDKDKMRLLSHGSPRNEAAYICASCGRMIRVRINTVISAVPIAQRMRWASKRHTTREEDTAYCLMGLFDVNMPLLYGEGSKSFIRLQENMLQDCKDHSILADRQPGILQSIGLSPVRKRYQSSVLAPSPRYFLDDIRHEWSSEGKDTRVRLNEGEITVSIYLCPLGAQRSMLNFNLRNKYLGFLNCIIGDDYLSRPAILLEATEEGSLSFRRCYERPTLFHITSEATDVISLAMLLGPGDLNDHQHLGMPEIPAQRFSFRFRSTTVLCEFEKLKRVTIKITGDETSSTYCADLGAPMRLTHATITTESPYRPRLDAASPKFSGRYVTGFSYGDIGIIPFSREGLELFFVAWGCLREFGREKRWCKIWTLSDMGGMGIAGLHDFDDDEGAIKRIVSQVEEKQGAVARLQPAQAELSEKDAAVLNPETLTPLLVRVSLTKMTFLRRSIFEIDLTQDHGEWQQITRGSTQI